MKISQLIYLHKKYCAVFLLCLLFIFPRGTSATDSPTVTEHRVTTNGSSGVDHWSVNTDGNYITWESDEDYNIYLYSTSSGQTTQVTSNGEASYWSCPKVCGDYVVWADARTGRNQYYLYKISTQQETALVLPGADFGGDILATDGTYVSMIRNHYNSETHSVTSYSVYVYNIVTQQYSDIALGPYDLDINNGELAIASSDENGYAVYKYNLSTMTGDKIYDFNTIAYGAINIKIADAGIVWFSETDRTDGDIYFYDFSDQSVSRITTDSAILSCWTMDISGDKIIWTDYRDDPNDWYYGDIYVYDLLTNTESIIIDTQSDKTNTSLAKVSTTDYVLATCDDINGDIENYVGYDVYYTDIDFAGGGSTPPVSDSTPPTFTTLPNDTRPINIDANQTITTNPYIITVNPTDDNNISKVEFYIDDNLICTDTTAAEDGTYSCAWDTSRYHSIISVYAYDDSDNRSTVLTRTTTVDPNLYQASTTTGITVLPETGRN